MRVILTAFGFVALAGCGVGERSYEMTKDQARGKLLAAKFERGIVPGSSSLKPWVQKDYDGNLEWHLNTEEDGGGNGWWCPLAIEPVDDDGKRVKVVNQCAGMMAAKDNASLDELVDATLTGRPPKFD